MDSSHKHFIRTIRFGFEMKVCNINTRRRPKLAFKSITEVYKMEDARNMRRPSVPDSRNVDGVSLFHYDPIPSTAQCLRTAYEELYEVKIEIEHDQGSDLDDETTLEQLREKSKSKKRKLSCGVRSSQTDSCEIVVDDSDLNEPISRLKSKSSKKSRPRKCLDGSFVPLSSISQAITSERNLLFKNSLHCKADPYSNLKIEALEEDQLASCATVSLDDHSSIGLNKSLGTCNAVAIKNLNSIPSESKESPVLLEEPSRCVANELSCKNLEDTEPLYAHVPFDETRIKVEDLDLFCPEFLVLSPSAAETKKEFERELNCSSPAVSESCDVFCPARIQEILEQNNSLAIQVSNMASPDDISFPKIEYEADSDPPKDDLESEFPLKQDVSFSSQESFPQNNSNDGSNVNGCSSPELHLHPERLLSTRKAMSPSSQEKLRLAMDSCETTNNVKNCSQRRVISPRQIPKKSNHAKGNLENTRISRSLPDLSTGCASVKDCSESAIAFTQRQMHDMQSLVGKLMNELKSLKDIVEQKLLFEAYRSITLKNDTVEVKTAIENATKIEESSSKWLNMMSRDCGRFCKIMKLTTNHRNTTNNVGSREGKKIKFADEAGGELCHVKFFEVVHEDH